MKLALITDAWHPQINGVVTTLQELVVALAPLGVQVEVIHPGLFRPEHGPWPQQPAVAEQRQPLRPAHGLPGWRRPPAGVCRHDRTGRHGPGGGAAYQ